MIAALLLALQAKAAPTIGDILPAINLQTKSQQPYEWHPGRVTVLSFCAFWCDTWKQQLPRVEEATQATKGLPVDYFTISVDGRWTDKAPAFGTILTDPGGMQTHALGVDRVPYTLVVDPSGKVVWSSYGTIRSTDLIRAIRATTTNIPSQGEGLPSSQIKESQTQPTIYLTFDDFPSLKLSDDLLDELRREDVKVTFFCIGQDTQERPDLARRAIREGHQLQIHSWSHDAKNPQLARCAELLKSLGATPDLYRPPGSETIQDLQGHKLIAPVIDPYDYQRPGTAELTRRLLSQARDGAVIQLHAGVSDTLAALPKIIANLRQRGFQMALLSSAGFPTRRH